MVEDDWPLSVEESSVKSQAKREVEKLLLLDKISWRQKSKVLCLREGDKNTSLFHRRVNTISRLLVDEVETTNPAMTGEGQVNFYRQLFTDEEDRRPLLDGLDFYSIDEPDNATLDLPFTEEELSGVVKGMARDKAPGPDGFFLAFFNLAGILSRKM